MGVAVSRSGHIWNEYSDSGIERASGTSQAQIVDESCTRITLLNLIWLWVYSKCPDYKIGSEVYMKVASWVLVFTWLTLGNAILTMENLQKKRC
jgi:hypothetical protein